MSDENITTWPERISLYQGENGEPIHYIRTDLVKPTMTVERAREILEGNEYFTNDKGGFHLPINQYKSHIRMESDMYTADELEAIAFLMRNP